MHAICCNFLSTSTLSNQCLLLSSFMSPLVPSNAICFICLYSQILITTEPNDFILQKLIWYAVLKYVIEDIYLQEINNPELDGAGLAVFLHRNAFTRHKLVNIKQWNSSAACLWLRNQKIKQYVTVWLP